MEHPFPSLKEVTADAPNRAPVSTEMKKEFVD
jgi:hypothetical protein